MLTALPVQLYPALFWLAYFFRPQKTIFSRASITFRPNFRTHLEQEVSLSVRAVKLLGSHSPRKLLGKFSVQNVFVVSHRELSILLPRACPCACAWRELPQRSVSSTIITCLKLKAQRPFRESGRAGGASLHFHTAAICFAASRSTLNYVFHVCYCVWKAWPETPCAAFDTEDKRPHQSDHCKQGAIEGVRENIEQRQNKEVYYWVGGEVGSIFLQLRGQTRTS